MCAAHLEVILNGEATVRQFSLEIVPAPGEVQMGTRKCVGVGVGEWGGGGGGVYVEGWGWELGLHATLLTSPERLCIEIGIGVTHCDVI